MDEEKEITDSTEEEMESIVVNVPPSGVAGELLQRLVELEARIAALEGGVEPTANANENEKDEAGLTEEDIAAIEEAGETQSDDVAMVEETFEDEEDIKNLRGNLKTAGRITKRRLNLAGYVAEKVGISKPQTLREANGILATFRKQHAVLKKRRNTVKWGSDLDIAVTRGNAGGRGGSVGGGSVKMNMDPMARITASWKKGE